MSRVRSSILLVCLVAVAVMSVTPVTADTCPDGDDDVVGVAIHVAMDPPAVTVDRESVTIYHDPEAGQPRRVCWTVTGMPATARLRFEPKEPAADDPFPVLIRKLTAKRTFANSGNPTGPATWGYGLRLVDANGATLAVLDPEVIVKGRGG